MREPPAFDKVRDEIEQFASRRAQVDFVTKLRADAKIERLDKPAEPKK
jgi:peptidyl-prolyl cis-trans isomerase C